MCIEIIVTSVLFVVSLGVLIASVAGMLVVNEYGPEFIPRIIIGFMFGVIGTALSAYVFFVNTRSS